jgi:hypothetical protein
VELALTVAGIVAPVFLIAGAGFAWCRSGTPYPTEFVTRLAMTLAVPCLIFTALMETQIDPAALTALSLASLAAYALVLGLSWAVVAILGLDRRSFVAPLTFGNTGNLGLPLALFAFGEIGLGYAVVVFAVMAVMTFTIGIWLVSGTGSVKAVLREPMVGATLLGTLFLVQGWTTPDWLTNTLRLAGQMAIPLMLLTLGVAVARLKPGRIGQAVWLSGVKLALCIAAGVLAGRVFGLDPVAFGVLVLQLATPVAVTSYLLAERYDADANAVAGLVMVSTAMSVAALPITLSFLLPGAS